MKNAFLRQVAKLFANKELEEYTFVFPNRRSSVFFGKYLAEENGKPLFSPRILTISEVFEYLSTFKVADDLTLLLKLWNAYHALQTELQTASGVKPESVRYESLDDFMPLGKIILDDFSDVDQYMANAEDIFTNAKDLSDLKKDPGEYLDKDQIEELKKIVILRPFTNPEDKGLETRRKYHAVCEILWPLYNKFRASLMSEGIAYSAMAYRQAAEAIMAEDDQNGIMARLGKLRKLVFIGFSAPSECEKVLMKHFRDKNGEGLFYWDFYSSMLTASHNFSSKLISECWDGFKLPDEFKLPEGGGLPENECKFNLIAASGATEQAMIASSLIDKDKDGIKTAIVVSDENLLLPLLEVLKGVKVNVTMGFPLKATSAASLMNLLFNLHYRSRYSSEGNLLLPGDVLVSIFNHPYIKAIDSAGASRASYNIKSKNRCMIETKENKIEDYLTVPSDSKLVEFIGKLVPSKVKKENDDTNLVPSVLDWLKDISEFAASYLPGTEKAFMNEFLDIFDRVSSSGIVLYRYSSVFSVLRSALRTRSVAFEGEPLEGVQIMGPLETRVLDFDKIIFLSFNEGVFPATGEQTSTFPSFLRKKFGLPTYETANSISAYNFYRLIQRASDVYMIYDTANTDSLKNREESRFVKQLVYDFGIEPKRLKYRFPDPSSSGAFLSDLEMKDEDCRSLKAFFWDLCPEGDKHKSFSPSSLNSYLDCKRRFFFSKIMNIKEEDELSDEVGAADYGTVYHFCMQKIYDKQKPNGDVEARLNINSELMKRIEDWISSNNNLDDLISEGFKEKLKIIRIEGQNIIIRESIKEYIKQTIAADIAKVQEGTGKHNWVNGPYVNVRNECPVDYPGKKPLVKDFSCARFYGVIDRLEEEENGIIRICDYKTGKFIESGSESFLKIFKKKGFDLKDEALFFPSKVLEEAGFDETLDQMFASGQKREKYLTVLFQMFVYAFLYCKKNDKTPPLDLSVYQLSLVDPFGPVTIRISDEHLKKFEERLAILLEEIRNLAEKGGNVEICQDESNCKMCYYNKYCRRVKSDE